MAKKLSDRYPHEEYVKLIEVIADYVIANNAIIRQVANYFTNNGIKISYVTVANLLNSNTTSKVINQTETLIRMQKAIDLSLKGYTVPQIAEMLGSTESIIYNALTSRLKKTR